MIIVRTRIVVVTIIVNYFAQLHDPVVDFLSSGALNLIMLESSVVVALKRSKGL